MIHKLKSILAATLLLAIPLTTTTLVVYKILYNTISWQLALLPLTALCTLVFVLIATMLALASVVFLTQEVK